MTVTLINPRERVAPSEFKPGAFGLSVISGGVGKAVWAGQKYLAGDDSLFTHAWMILDNGEVIEAEPGGARIRPVTEYLDHDRILVCDKPVQTVLQGIRDLYAERGASVAVSPYTEQHVREEFVATARDLEGAEYGYLQYLWIGLAARGWRPAWLKRLVGNERLICSQLVDLVAKLNGVELFKDKRWEGEVTPGDLWSYACAA